MITHCPRCDAICKEADVNGWGVPYCTACKIALYSNPTEYRMQLSEKNERGASDALWWEVDRNECILLRSNGQLTMLPWLPYTITKEDLAKYLVLV